MTEIVERPKTRREQLVEATYGLLLEKGFEGLRVRDVAARVGINIATLHHYFPTKEVLIQEVAVYIVGFLERVPTKTSLAPEEAVFAHIDHILAELDAVPERLGVLNELFVRSARDEALRELVQKLEADWHGYLLPLFEAGILEGIFRPRLEPRAAAVLVTSFLKGAALNPDPEAARAAATELLHGFRTEG